MRYVVLSLIFLFGCKNKSSSLTPTPASLPAKQEALPPMPNTDKTSEIKTEPTKSLPLKPIPKISPQWTLIVDNPDLEDLKAIWGYSKDDIWVAGMASILHYEGSKWKIVSQLPKPKQFNLENPVLPNISPAANLTLLRVATGERFGIRTIWGNDSNSLWFGGSMKLMHVDENGMHSVAVPLTEKEVDPRIESFSKIWGFKSDEIFALHSSGYMFKFNGKNWSRISRASKETFINDAWVSGKDDVWAVGYDLFHWNGKTWKKFFTPGQGLSAVWGAGSNDVWAVGEEGEQAKGLILHWDGKTWTKVESPTQDALRTIWGSGPDDIWAIGSTLNKKGEVTSASFVHYNGTKWVATSTMLAAGITQIWGSGPNDVWAVGEHGRILHYQ